MPAMKPTRSTTNSLFMKDQLSLRCDKSHVHQPPVGGRCRDAAFNPLPFVQPILEGIALTAALNAKRSASLIGRQAMEEQQAGVINAVTKAANTIPISSEERPPMTSSIKKVSGGVLPIAYNLNEFKAQYIDGYTSEVLDPLMA